MIEFSFKRAAAAEFSSFHLPDSHITISTRKKKRRESLLLLSGNQPPPPGPFCIHDPRRYTVKYIQLERKGNE
jgi:hypothetical protein